MSGSAVPEWVHRQVGYRAWAGNVHAGAVAQTGTVARGFGQITEKFREAVKELAEQEQIPVYQFGHKEDKDDIANDFRRRRGTRDGIVFIGVAQEKAHAFNGKKVNRQFQFDRDKTVSTSITTTSTSMMRSLVRCF